MGIEIDGKIYISRNHAFSEIVKENKKLKECREILKDFLTTKECPRTWIEEMYGTITEVLKETEG